MSFRLKTILGVALIEASLLLILIWNTLYYLERSNRDQLLNHAETTLALLSVASRDAILSWDLDTLETIVNDARNMPGMVYIRILDDDGNVLAAAGDVFADASTEHEPFSSSDKIFAQFVEIVESESKFGRIEVGLDVSYINAYLAEAKQWAIGIALLEMLLVAVFSFALGTYLTRQLRDLIQASDRVGKGQLNFRLSVRGKDELSQAAAAFNMMTCKLQERIRQEQTIMKSALDAIITMDFQGHIVDFNPAAEKIFGYRAEHVIGKIWWEQLIPSGRREAFEEGMRHFIDTDEWELIGNRIEMKAMHANGHEIPIEIAIESTQINGRPFFISYLRDISIRLNYEKELIEAKDAAEAGSRAKTNFLAVMSHEIRTPLNAVLGLMVLLEETELTPKQRKWLETARNSGEHLLDLINNILDYSKLEAGKIILEPAIFVIRDFLYDVLNILNSRAETKDLDLAGFVEEDVPVQFQADAGRVRQVLINLIGNAIKFTDSGHVLVKVSRVLVGGEHRIRFSVMDTGPGIPSNKLKHIFKEFTQAESGSQRNYEGSGLGLAISKRLVETMGGYIGVDSGIKQGACFWFELPSEKEEGHFSSPQQSPGCTALLLEPGGASRMMLTYQLTAMGVAVDSFSNVRETVHYFNRIGVEKNYNWVFINKRFADHESAARLYKEKKPNLIILLISSMDSITFDELIKNGFNFYLEKPYKQSDLVNRLVDYTRSLDGEYLITPDKVTENFNKLLTQTAPITNQISSTRILMAEDSPTNQMVALGMLASEGLEADVADNGVEALKKISEYSYDLVLMDIAMPELDGIEAMKKIRLMPPPKCDIPIIAITAHSLGREREHFIDLGFNDYVSKPIDKAILVKTLRKWLSDYKELKASAVNEKLGSGETPSRYEEVLEMEVIQNLIRDIGPDSVPLMIETFLEELAKRITSLDQAVNENDFISAERDAHTIKSTSGAFGGLKLQAIASELELSCKQKDSESVKKLAPQLKYTAKNTKAALTRFLN